MRAFISLACLIALGWAQNVGIGTSTPAGRLHVVGSEGIGRSVIIDNREIKFRGDGVAHFSLFGPTTGRSRFSISNSSSSGTPGVEDAELVSVLGNGNVGIGNTNPTERLHVQGNLRLQGAFMPNNNPGNSGDVLLSAGPGNPPTWAANPICAALTLNRFVKVTSTDPRVTCNTTLAETGANNNIFNADGAPGPFAVDKFSIYGTAAAPYAVCGYNNSTSATMWAQNTGTGLALYANSAGGTAVWGASNASYGVYGSTPAVWAGVGGVSTNGNGIGVAGANANLAFIGPTGGAGGAFHGDEFGVFATGATTTNGTGVVGVGNGLVTFYFLTQGSGGAFTGASYGVYGRADATTGDRAGGYFTANGGGSASVGARVGATNYKIIGTGLASTVIWNRTNSEQLIFFCPEAPEILFMDFGRGQLQNGRAYIELDPDFVHNIWVDDEHPLRVFIQLEDDCKGVYVTNKSARGFEVRELEGGTSNARFIWQVVANRRDEYDPQTGALVSKHQGVRKPKFTKPAVAKAELRELPLPRLSPEAEAKLKQMQQILRGENK